MGLEELALQFNGQIPDNFEKTVLDEVTRTPSIMPLPLETKLRIACMLNQVIGKSNGRLYEIAERAYQYNQEGIESASSHPNEIEAKHLFNLYAGANAN